MERMEAKMGSKIYDAIIVGAGPGGSSLAAMLAKAGLHVLMLEKQSFPRYKVCGGGITKRALMKMPADITPIIRDQADSLVAVKGNKYIQVFKNSTPFIYLVMRSELDHLLAEHAAGCGAELIENAFVKKVTEYEDHVKVYTQNRQYSGKYLVGADGVDSVVAKLVGLMPAQRKALTLEYEFRCDRETAEKYKGKIVIDNNSVPNGHTWIFPKNGILSTGIVSYSLNQKRISQYLLSFLDDQGVDGILISAKEAVIMSANGIGQSMMTKRTALIGDAAGLVDSFTGEGIYYALWSAELLSARLLETIKDGQDTYSNYQNDVDGAIVRELKIMDRLSREFYKDPPFMQKIAAHFPELSSMYFDVLEGKRDYEQLYMRFNEVKKLERIFYQNSSS